MKFKARKKKTLTAERKAELEETKYMTFKQVMEYLEISSRDTISRYVKLKFLKSYRTWGATHKFSTNQVIKLKKHRENEDV